MYVACWCFAFGKLNLRPFEYIFCNIKVVLTREPFGEERMFVCQTLAFCYAVISATPRTLQYALQTSAIQTNEANSKVVQPWASPSYKCEHAPDKQGLISVDPRPGTTKTLCISSLLYTVP